MYPDMSTLIMGLFMYSIASICPLLERVTLKVYCDTQKEGFLCTNDYIIEVDISRFVVDLGRPTLNLVVVTMRTSQECIP